MELAWTVQLPEETLDFVLEAAEKALNAPRPPVEEYSLDELLKLSPAAVEELRDKISQLSRQEQEELYALYLIGALRSWPHHLPRYRKDAKDMRDLASYLAGERNLEDCLRRGLDQCENWLPRRRMRKLADDDPLHELPGEPPSDGGKLEP